MTQTPTRDTIDPKYRWNAESVFATREAWQTELAELTDILPLLEQFKGTLGESAATLADWMDTFESVYTRIDRLTFYAFMSREVDATDEEASRMAAQAGALDAKANAAASFVEPELLAIGEAKLREWIAGEPRLQPAVHTIDNLFRRQAHVRSAEIEQLFGMMGEPAGLIESTFSMLMNADVQFAPAAASDGTAHDVTHGSIAQLLNSADREVRRTSWESYTDGYLTHRHSLANNLMAHVKMTRVFSQARGYESNQAMSLFENHIPQVVYDTLIDTYRANLPTWHKYWAVRRRILGVDTLYSYDTWAPLAKTAPIVPYEQAVEWIAAGMAPLGEDYADTIVRGCLEERWVDVYPTVGKRQGAFSYGAKGTHPFIMMSYGDNLFALSTLAHELGHSMHSYYSKRDQHYINTNYTLFAAEVASNFNQALTRAYLMKEKANDRDFQIALIEEAMYNFHRYFFQMPTLARFEADLHARGERGEGVTAVEMNASMADRFREAYGSEMETDPERDGSTWARFGHLYSPFYVYQYATGISAAHSLSRRILANEPGAVEAYRGFLSLGGSMYPLDALKTAGVDMTTPEPIETTFAILADYVDRLDQLTK